jgi:hypothetical protein
MVAVADAVELLVEVAVKVEVKVGVGVGGANHWVGSVPWEPTM